MNRRAFTKKACLMCLGTTAISSVLVSCQSTFYTTGSLEQNGISIPKSDFTFMKNDQPQTRSYIIVRNEKLEFPIYVYRFSETEYSAVLMKCAHQGAELNAAGDHLHCSSHGSEYDNKGNVTQGPAERNLRSFKVSVGAEKLFIDLT
jgi:Rieske Fe-S protein